MWTSKTPALSFFWGIHYSRSSFCAQPFGLVFKRLEYNSFLRGWSGFNEVAFNNPSDGLSAPGIPPPHWKNSYSISGGLGWCRTVLNSSIPIIECECALVLIFDRDSTPGPLEKAGQGLCDKIEHILTSLFLLRLNLQRRRQFRYCHSKRLCPIAAWWMLLNFWPRIKRFYFTSWFSSYLLT